MLNELRRSLVVGKTFLSQGLDKSAFSGSVLKIELINRAGKVRVTDVL